ncbi:carbohydrate ABC transporter permease [Candidatus Poriferisodalis sp.]|uniref:carbohydrate ABC transporter permease n=1 Tax=Candidatus Poriferisodalis sp. TaxID=3101277 RepID=UPI0023836B44|nr:sugar ABC transporter permease [Acidimicrobiaceae bacterium]
MTVTTAPPGASPRRSLFGTASLHGGWRSAFWFLLPALVGFVAFYLYPALRGVYISFTDWNLIANRGSWVGTDNYDRLFSDRQVWESLKITFKYTVINIVSQTILAVLIAVLMDRLTKSVTIRGILLLPWLIPNVIVALLWVWMLDGNLGIVNDFLGLFGMDPVRFFTDTGKVIPSLAGINTWRHMGYTALLIFAGLQTIPRSLYEAAAVDGATERQMFRDITIPLLRPILALVLVITIVGSLQVFDTVFVATGGFGGQPGGPANASRVIYLYIYQNAFDFNQLGYAATISVLLVAILLTVTFLQLKLLRAGESDLA